MSTWNFKDIWPAVLPLWLLLCWKMTYPSCIWGSCSPLLSNLPLPNMVGFRISYFPFCCRMVKLHVESCITGLPKNDIPHPYLRICFSVSIPSTPIKFGHYCIWFPIFFPNVEQSATNWQPSRKFSPKLKFLPTVKNWGWSPKNKISISENHLQDKFPISIGRFLRVRVTKHKVPIGAIVKFSVFWPWKNLGRVLSKVRPAY